MYITQQIRNVKNRVRTEKRVSEILNEQKLVPDSIKEELYPN